MAIPDETEGSARPGQAKGLDEAERTESPNLTATQPPPEIDEAPTAVWPVAEPVTEVAIQPEASLEAAADLFSEAPTIPATPAAPRTDAAPGGDAPPGVAEATAPAPRAVAEPPFAEAPLLPEPPGRVVDGAPEKVAPAQPRANDATPPLAADAALLPMAPGAAMDEVPTDLLPAAPRARPGGLSGLSSGRHRLPPVRLTTLGARRGAIAPWAPYASAVGIVTLVALLGAMLWPAITALSARIRQPGELPALTEQLNGATTVTPLDARNAGFGSQTYAIAPAFVAYYAAHDGQDTLGQAITPSFTSNLGETQFFTGGALVSAGRQTADALASAASDGPGDLAPDLARNGVDDSDSGVIALSLNAELLALGSKAQVGGAGSGMTYVTLRAAAQIAAFTAEPIPAAGDQVIQFADGTKVVVSTRRAFVVEGRRGKLSVGHVVLPAFWTYITSDTISPQGWLVNIGLPLTEPLPLTVTRDGVVHHLLAQAFTQVTLIADRDQLDANGAPTISVQPAGLDYLRTAGGPTVYTSAHAKRWLTQDGALRTTPGASNVVIGLNANTAVTLSGATRWLMGGLWYAVTWKSSTRGGAAWVSGDALTTVTPTAPPVDGFDALSPDLASYLAQRGQNTGAVVYDLTRGVMYSYNGSGLFIMGSSAKVPLLVSYLENIESQGRGPNGYEQAVMSQMIQQSDNNAAEVIYDTLGFDAGQRAHMSGWGITDYAPDPNGWGWGRWSPGDMARLLTLLQQGKILNASDRAFALNLMSNVESDQQFGVGDSAPHGATFAMKDGWVTGPDGAWAINSSGIVTAGHETYIVTVYTGELDSFNQGIDIVNHVCGAIGQALT